VTLGGLDGKTLLASYRFPFQKPALASRRAGLFPDRIVNSQLNGRISQCVVSWPYHSSSVSRSRSLITMGPARSQPTRGRSVPRLLHPISSWFEAEAGAPQWPCVVRVAEWQCVAHAGALLRVGRTAGQRHVDLVETLPCAAHVGERRCVWVPAIMAAFGTAPRGGTGGADGGHMASAHAGVGLISATFGSAECSEDPPRLVIVKSAKLAQASTPVRVEE
jgi:hypothetical protein